MIDFSHNLAITVIGAGSWGRALSAVLSQKGLKVALWGRNVDVLRGEVLFDYVRIESDLGRALQGADWVISTLPCAAIALRAPEIVPLIPPHAFLVSGTKGLHFESGLRPSEIWHNAGFPLSRFIALSGPNLASEIVAGVPTSTVVASENDDAASAAQQVFRLSRLRVYRNDDLVGVELGGALKNVIAIAAGICDGLEFGDNAKAALITRGWSEMTRLAIKLGAREETLYGLSGMGDLIATCASYKSRNHTMGELLGKGVSFEEAKIQIGHVAEGVYTTQAALQLAEQYNVELPITEQIQKVLCKGRSAIVAVEELMNRPERHE